MAIMTTHDLPGRLDEDSAGSVARGGGEPAGKGNGSRIAREPLFEEEGPSVREAGAHIRSIRLDGLIAITPLRR
jgi:hypothetical protein